MPSGLGLGVLIVSTALAHGAGAPNATERWVGTWVAAPQLCEPGNLPPAPGFVDRTVRQIVRVSLGGARLRVRFSNEFGTSTLTIRAAHLAAAGEDGTILPDTDKPLTFGGQSSVSVPPGAPMLSDPIDFALASLSSVAITIYLKDAPAAVTAHPGSRTTSYLAPGNKVSSPALSGAVRVDHWYFLSGIDVISGEGAALVTLGDSITDGRGSTTNGNNRWPDVLAQRLQAQPETAPVAVLNQGIGGNCVQSDCLGPSALARLDRDVLAQDGVRWLVVFEAINDIGTHAGTPRDIIAAYDQIIARAHGHGIRVYGATLGPFGGSSYSTPASEADRQQVNAWIRGSGRFDAVIDFEAATRDPQQPLRLLPAFDSGDHLHLSPAGYKAMAEAVDLALFGQ